MILKVCPLLLNSILLCFSEQGNILLALPLLNCIQIENPLAHERFEKYLEVKTVFETALYTY
jgi:hypothetical protein